MTLILLHKSDYFWPCQKVPLTVFCITLNYLQISLLLDVLAINSS